METVSPEKIAYIQDVIQNNTIVLFMKGTAEMPMCGFSGFVVQALTRSGRDFFVVNVLDDPDIRQGIKEYTNWPTIPQLYVQGEFIGGADIVRDMSESGELETLLKKAA